MHTNGQEVSAEIIKPEQIADSKPRWEDYLEADDRKKQLEAERGELLEYQDKLDKARERLDDPNLSKSELDALDKELGEAMPDRVRSNMDQEQLTSIKKLEMGADSEKGRTANFRIENLKL